MFTALEQYAEFAQSAGAVAALALVCLLQYACHLYRLRAVQRSNVRFRSANADLEVELGSLQEERLLTTLENEFLREFVAQTELSRAVDVMLRRLVPHPSRDFAALLLFRDGRLLPYRSRGLADRSRSGLVMDPDLVAHVLYEGAVVVEGEPLRSYDFLAPLTPEERGRTDQLVLLRVGSADDPVGILATTSLYPPGAPRSQQLALGRRLMQSVAGNIQWARALESREDELKLTTEMLELRAITDRNYPTPLAMIERFVDGLRRIVGAERVSLFLVTPDVASSLQPIARAGLPLAPGIDRRYREHELALAAHGRRSLTETTEVDATSRGAIGVDSLVGEVFVTPIVRDDSTVGVIVFSSRKPMFDRGRTGLVDWARGHLARTLDRVQKQAHAEQRARQDSLTDLANRGEFDKRIATEIARGLANGTPVSLLLIDLDHFKRVNDTHGHRAGDEVLRVTARVLRQSVSRIRSNERSLVARYGGEEIAVLLPGLDVAGAQRVAEDLRSNIERQIIPHDDTVITVTASIGVSTCPHSATDADGLIAAADAALYRAKDLGRNRVVVGTSRVAVPV